LPLRSERESQISRRGGLADSALPRSDC
jgi:hypothetical protein